MTITQDLRPLWLRPGCVNKVPEHNNEVQHALSFRGRLAVVTASNQATPDALLGVVRRTRRRMLLQRGVERAFRAVPWLLIYAIVGVATIKLADPPQQVVRWVMWGSSLPLLWVLTLVVTTPRVGAMLEAAVQLDRFHGLEGRVANGVAFLGKVQRTALEQCALDDAVALTYTLRPAEVLPWRPPRNLAVSTACMVLLGVLLGVEVRQDIYVTVADTPETPFSPFVLAADDLAYLDEEVAKMVHQAQAADSPQVGEQLSLFIADLKAGRLDRNTALERLAAIEQTMTESSDLDREARKEALADMGSSLQNSKASKALGDALRKNRLADAEKALRDLAQAVRANKVSRQDLERLRAALEKASAGNQERLERLEAQRKANQERRSKLLNKRNNDQTPAEAAATERELKDADRELKRLDRQQKRAASAAKQLSQLDRELAQAANELMKEMGKAAERMDKGAEQLNQAQRQDLSDDEKRALKKQLQELKEMLRQAKSGNDERQKQLERFRQRAAGNQGKQPGAPRQGNGQPGSGTPKLGLGKGQGGNIPIPVPGQGVGSGSEPGGGTTAGTAKGGDVAGDSTTLHGKTQDVAAAGIDSGQGPSASEVVFGAAARGFTGVAYRKVYTDYKTVAEEALTSDEIPSGYKFYVRRYFQLIRPRE